MDFQNLFETKWSESLKKVNKLILKPNFLIDNRNAVWLGKTIFPTKDNPGKIIIKNYLKDVNPKIVENVLLHEIAHIISSYYGSKGHDKIWKNICTIIGIQPKRLNDDSEISIILNKQKNYVFSCKCKENHLCSKIIYNKIIKNKKVYICLKCKTELKFVGLK